MMQMFVIVWILTAVMMAMMGMTCVGVSAALWLERGVHVFHNEPHVHQHGLQHMIGFDVEVLSLNFDGYVAVAQVIGGS